MTTGNGLRSALSAIGLALPPDIVAPCVIGCSRGGHSEVVEFTGIRGGVRARFLVKRLTHWDSWDKAQAEVTGEFDVLNRLRATPDAELAASVPCPLRVFPDRAAIILEAVPGQGLHRLLRNRVHRASPLWVRQAVTDAVRRCGAWLGRFHRATDGGLDVFDTAHYVTELRRRVDRCVAAGMSAHTATSILDTAEPASARLTGVPLPMAMGHGDFIPQNVLVDRERICVVDFGASRPKTPIYEDIGSMVAALAMMEKYPFYSSVALASLRQAFLAGYGGSLRQDVLALYALKSAVRMLSEIARGQGPGLGASLRMWRAQSRVQSLALQLPAQGQHER